MADTPNHEYNVPDQGDQDWHNPLNENFEAFDSDIELRDEESELSTYTPAAGAKFLSTDTGVVYVGDGSDWTAAFVHPAYDPSTGEAQFDQTVSTPGLTGALTGGDELTDIAGNNLTISNGQLDASTGGGGGGGGGISSLSGGDGVDPASISDGDTLSVAWGDANDLDSDGNVTGGGGGGGNWTVNNNLLEPTDSNIDGIDVDEVNASLLETGSDSVTVTVGGARTLELTAEGGNTAGNVLAGHSSNSFDSGIRGATISGGGYDDGNAVLPNTITGNYGSIGGGFGNTTTSDAATVGGGRENVSDAVHATVGGGFSNTVGGKGGAVGGGEQNDVYDEHGTVGGGQNNEAGSDDGDSGSNTHATVGGGEGNTAGADHTTICGGLNNTIDSGQEAVIAGGSNNESGGDINFIGGGTDNTAAGLGVVIGGGYNNTNASLQSFYSAIAGGRDNASYGQYSAIGGGKNNQTGVDNDDRSPGYATVAGGQNNEATGTGATVGGGDDNEASGNRATVAGGELNVAGAAYATIAGGGPADGSNPQDTNNVVHDNYGTIAGGGNNQAGTDDGDPASAEYATVSGGSGNEASAAAATVGGGGGNDATGTAAFIGGGFLNEASGDYTMVPGGFDSAATGNLSFAAGRSANADARGAFVWADASPQSVTSNLDNEFKVQAGGGAVIYSASNLGSGVTLNSGSGSWSSVSTRTAKSNVDPVDGPAVLDAVEDLEISTWEYDAEDDAVHMGPMAEDFHDAFGLGPDDQHITNVDADGVALAAIQGLSAKLDEKDERIDDQQAQIDDLEAENEALRERLSAVEDRLDGIETASVASADD